MSEDASSGGGTPAAAGPQMELSLHTPQAGWGEGVRGSVSVTGPGESREYGDVRIRLTEVWNVSLEAGDVPAIHEESRTREEQLLAAPLALGPGESRSFDFELTVPWGGLFRHTWYVVASLRLDPETELLEQRRVLLLPPAPFRRLAEVLAEVSGIPVSYWEALDEGAAAELLARGETVQVLDGLRLELRLEGDRLAGELVVNPQEHTVLDVLRSFVRADRSRYPVEVPVSDPESAREEFERILRPLLG